MGKWIFHYASCFVGGSAIGLIFRDDTDWQKTIAYLLLGILLQLHSAFFQRQHQ